MNNNTFNIGTFNTPNSAVNLGGTLEGGQNVTQNNYNFPEPKQAEATQTVADLLQDISSRYPQATNAEIVEIIDRGLATMQQNNPKNGANG